MGLEVLQRVPLSTVAKLSMVVGSLGTSTAAEGREYFSDLDKHVIEFQWDQESSGLIDLAFNKDRTEDRKKWLLRVCSSCQPRSKT